jgi:hypothetical protein
VRRLACYVRDCLRGIVCVGGVGARVEDSLQRVPSSLPHPPMLSWLPSRRCGVDMMNLRVLVGFLVQKMVKVGVVPQLVARPPFMPHFDNLSHPGNSKVQFIC